MSSSVLMRLMASSIKIAPAAGKIIRDVMAGGQLGIVEKGVNDPQTEADRSAQRLILASLKKLFPNVQVIGEEGISDLNVPPEWLITDLDQDFLNKKVPEGIERITEEDIIVWVDPLDGTSEYTAGFLERVTVLIGIAVNESPVGGIIHQPYYKNPDESLGRTIWGMKGLGIGGIEPTFIGSERLVITTTRSHSTPAVQAALDALKPAEVLKVGGAGYKVLQLLEGTANAYVFASAGCKKWDTCAPEAVLEAAGGILTDITGGHYCYDGSVTHMNKRGVLATPPTVQHHVIVATIPDEVKESLVSPKIM